MSSPTETKPATIAYIDGGVLQEVNQLLSGAPVTQTGILVLDEFIEAIVLRDAFIPALNHLPATEQRPLDEFFVRKGIYFQLNEEATRTFRTSKTIHSAFTMFVADDISRYIIDFAHEHAINQSLNPIEFRNYLTGKLSQTTFHGGLIAEINDIIAAAEALELDLVIRPEWLPFAFPTYQSFPQKLYNELAHIHRLKVDNLKALVYPHTVYLPPLLSIVLDRASDRSNVLDAIWATREDFTAFRVASKQLEARIHQESRLKDQLDAVTEYEDQIAMLARKAGEIRTGILQAVWEIVKHLKNPLLMIDQIYKSALSEQRLHRIEGFYDIWDKAMSVRNYSSLIQKVFGEVATENPVRSKAVSIIERIVNPSRTNT